MKHIPERLAQVFRTTTGDISQDPFVALEYQTGNPHVNIAEVCLRQRYPIAGRMMNEISTMTVYVAGGKGSVTIDGKRIQIEGGDVVEISSLEKYSWDPRSGLRLVIASTPPWTPEQCKKVE